MQKMDRKRFKNIESYKEIERFSHNEYTHIVDMNELYEIVGQRANELQHPEEGKDLLTDDSIMVLV